MLTAALTAATLATLATPGRADDSLTNPSAFETAYATSFYGLDACGAQLTGRMFRQVLTARFAECPFSAEARAHFEKYTKAQRIKSTDRISQMIIDAGGLPRQLSGMTTTCHAQISSAPVQKLQDQLDAYQRGEIKPSTILPAPCDAAEMVP